LRFAWTNVANRWAAGFCKKLSVWQYSIDSLRFECDFRRPSTLTQGYLFVKHRSVFSEMHPYHIILSRSLRRSWAAMPVSERPPNWLATYKQQPELLSAGFADLTTFDEILASIPVTPVFPRDFDNAQSSNSLEKRMLHFITALLFAASGCIDPGRGRAHRCVSGGQVGQRLASRQRIRHLHRVALNAQVRDPAPHYQQAIRSSLDT
jgi:hypothetical protein